MVRKGTGSILFLGFVFICSFSGFAQSSLDILTIQPFTSKTNVPAGGDFKIAVQVEINSDYHINSNNPLDPSLIPTELRFEPIAGMSFGKILFPDAEMKRVGFSEDELAVYEGSITIFCEVTLKDDFELGPVTLTGILSYQACTDQNCFMPEEITFELPINIVAATTLVEPINENIFANWPEHAGRESEDTQQQFTRDEAKAKEIIEKGLIYAMAAFFLFGLALNLTPCVYPVIPITVSYFGGQTEKDKGQAFFRALVYILGIALVFALLGLVSGLAGKQWGFLFQNPWFVIVITVIILAMAASMFGVFEIQVPTSLMTKFGQAREGLAGAFIMGLTVGIVIAPCAAGIIIGLVGLVAKLGIVVQGTILFFIMGLGLGLPYLVLASFSGLLNKLPQSGMWMVWIKKFFGILLVGVALYFFLPQAKHIEDMQGFFFGLLAIFGGLLLGFLEHDPGYTKAFTLWKKIFGILLILLGVFGANSAIHFQPPEIEWKKYSNEGIEKFLTEGKPVFLDFYADWCAPCKELDRKTFTDPTVVERAKKFTMVKVDCTVPDKNIKAFMDQFQVSGMPTLIFLTATGEELKRFREIGFIRPEIMVERMQITVATSGESLN